MNTLTFFLVFLVILGVVALLKPTWCLYFYVLLIPGLSLAHVELPILGTLSGMITLVIVLVLLIHALMRRVKLKVSPITWPFLVFIGANSVAFLRSGQELLSIILVVYYLVLHLVVYSTISNEKLAQRLLMLFALVTIVLSALGISSYLIGWPPWAMVATFRIPAIGVVKRLQGPAADPNAFAYVFLLGLPFITLQIFSARSWARRLIWIIGLYIGITGLILTFSRSAYIGFAVSFIILFWLAERRMKWRYFTITALIVVALLIFFPGPWKVWMTKRIASIGQLSGDVARVQQFQGAWLTFLDHPFFGVGLGRAQEAVLNYIPNAIAPYPHNDILMTSVEMGLLGLVPLFIIFYRVIAIPLRTAFRTRDEHLRNFLVAVVAAIVGFLVQGLFIFNMNWGVIWFIMAIGFSMSVSRHTNVSIHGMLKQRQKVDKESN